MDPASIRTELPTGTVTFLFTDIEGSTKLVQRLGSAFRGVLEEHHRILREAIHGAGGVDRATEGDAFFAVFPTADAGVAAAVAAQRALAAQPWPAGVEVRVRMGLHTGEGILGGDDYIGMDVHRAARIAAAGHGGQILVSRTTAALGEPTLGDGVSLRDLGAHRLKDLPDPERLSQVVVGGFPQDFPPLRSLEVATNLPAFPTAFIGRHDDLSRLRERLEGARIVTLTGPGGTGKTRLAVETAREELPRFPDGVTFVDLSPITDAALVPRAIAEALRVQPSGDEPVLDAVAERLRDRTTLLVLDNFEQVMPAAPHVARLVSDAPTLTVMTTSREPLGIAGEREFPVAPMGADAVALFVERARAIDPAFDVSGEAGDAIAEICRRLDGLPLAVELAAARVRTLGVEEILERLDRRLPLLTGGARDAPARQRTLRAAIEWGHDLLDEPERVLFRRLSVFAGGWTLEAAQEVADLEADPGETLDLLAALVQKSLVRRIAGGPQGRFGMYETLREFAAERLDEAGEGGSLRERHLAWVVALTERTAPELIGEAMGRYADLLAAEHDNVRAALAWSIGERRAEPAQRIMTAVWRFWQFRGHLVEASRWAEQILELPSAAARTPVRAAALVAAAGISYWNADYDEMEARCREAFDIFTELGDDVGRGDALYNQSFVPQMRGDFADALEMLSRAAELFEGRGYRLGLGRVAMARSFTATQGHDPEAARRYSDEAIRLLAEQGDWEGMMNALGSAGLSRMLQGDLDDATPIIRRVTREYLNAMNFTGVVIGFRMFATLASARGQHERAARLLGAAEAGHERFHVRPPRAIERIWNVEETSRTMSPEAFDAALEEGRAMSFEEAVAYAESED